MKKLTIAALLAGQVLTAAGPAFGADFAEARDQRAGAFAGFRVRMPLDGPQRRQLRAGLAVAPTLSTRDMRGDSRTRIGEGLEFGYRSRRPLSFSVAGRDLPGVRLGAQQADDDHHGLSTGEILLIAGGIIVVSAAVVSVVLIDAINDSSE